jgi:hypothetical protein
MRARTLLTGFAVAALALVSSACPTSVENRSAKGETKGAASRHFDRPYKSTGTTRQAESAIIVEDPKQASDAVERELLQRMPPPPW